MKKKKPVITKINKNNSSLDAYAQQVENIWGKRDLERPLLFQWLSVIQHAGAVAEEVRKSAWHNVVHELAEVLVWWLSFVTSIRKKPNRDTAGLVFHCNILPSDAVWFKYPNLCPVCFGYELVESKNIDPTEKDYTHLDKLTINAEAIDEAYDKLKNRPCQCMSRKYYVENRSNAFKKFVKKCIYAVAERKRHEKPRSLMILQESIINIFNPNISVLTIEEIAFHLLEEIGEVAEALSRLHQQPHLKRGDRNDFVAERKIRLRNLSEELADIFTWTVSLLEKTHKVLICTLDYIKYQYTDKKKADMVKTLLEPTSNIADLVWCTYSKKTGGLYMVCEDCGKEECDENHVTHSANSGMLFGNNAQSFYEEIVSIKFP